MSVFLGLLSYFLLGVFMYSCVRVFKYWRQRNGGTVRANRGSGDSGGTSRQDVYGVEVEE